MRVFVTGGSGVLGRAVSPLLRAHGHEVAAPGRSELDLFDPAALRRAAERAGAIFHLATHIPPPEQHGNRDAWRENDVLRAEVSRLLVDAALGAETELYVQPSVTFLYPPGGPVDEDTPVRDVPAHLRSALEAEAETARFAAAGGRGVVLRIGRLDGPGTWYERPDFASGSTLHVDDAGSALVAALGVPSGVYNVCRDGERVSNARFKRASGWRPER